MKNPQRRSVRIRMVFFGSTYPDMMRTVLQPIVEYHSPVEVRCHGTEPEIGDLYEGDGQTFKYEEGASLRHQFKVSQARDGQLNLEETVINQNQKAMFGVLEGFGVMTK